MRKFVQNIITMHRECEVVGTQGSLNFSMDVVLPFREKYRKNNIAHGNNKGDEGRFAGEPLLCFACLLVDCPSKNFTPQLQVEVGPQHTLT